MPITDCGWMGLPPGVTAQHALQMLGPTVQVDIGFDPAFNYQQPGTAILQSQAQKMPALIDTGAGESCIDDVLAQQINLAVIDRVKVAGVGGTTEVNVYLAHIVIPSLGFFQWGRFAGAHLAAGQQVHRALLGRSLLRDMLLVYDGRDGTVKLSR